jgi:hypothetical protein
VSPEDAPRGGRVRYAARASARSASHDVIIVAAEKVSRAQGTGNVVTLSEFKQAIARTAVPPELSPALLALWHDARGDWAAAHQVAQDIDDATGAWIHAYLHRKEGDLANAGYWYRRAGQPVAGESLPAEWERIAGTLLDAS